MSESVDRPPRSGALSPALELCLRLVDDYLNDRADFGESRLARNDPDYLDATEALYAIRAELEASYRPVWTAGGGA